MPTTVNQHNNEPILVITFANDVKAEAVVRAYMDSVEASKQSATPVYRLFDFRSARSNYGAIFSNLMAVIQGVAGAAIAPTLDAVFVGQPYMADFFARQQVNFFEDMEEAVTHACSTITQPVMSV